MIQVKRPSTSFFGRVAGGERRPRPSPGSWSRRQRVGSLRASGRYTDRLLICGSPGPPIGGSADVGVRSVRRAAMSHTGPVKWDRPTRRAPRSGSGPAAAAVVQESGRIGTVLRIDGAHTNVKTKGSSCCWVFLESFGRHQRLGASSGVLVVTGALDARTAAASTPSSSGYTARGCRNAGHSRPPPPEPRHEHHLSDGHHAGAQEPR